jgi:hypothetical protein
VIADRDVALGGGFVVAPDELHRAARQLHVAADIATPAVHPTDGTSADQHHRQPGWLADIDTLWRERVHLQLTALRGDAQALDATL